MSLMSQGQLGSSIGVVIYNNSQGEIGWCTAGLNDGANECLDTNEMILTRDGSNVSAPVLFEKRMMSVAPGILPENLLTMMGGHMRRSNKHDQTSERCG